MATRPRWLILLFAAVASFVVGAAAVAAVALLTAEDADSAQPVGAAVATAGLANDVSGLLQELESPLVAADPAERDRIANQLAAHERRAGQLIASARENVDDEGVRNELVRANAEIRAVARNVRTEATRPGARLTAEVNRGRRRLDRVRYRVDRLVAELREDLNGRPTGRLAELRSSLFDRPPIDLPHTNLVLRGSREGQLAGASVARAGDVNGDGRDDIVVAAPGSGDVYVVFGSSSNREVRLDALGPGTGFAITGLPASFPSPDDEFALIDAADDLAVAGVGDVNGDGLDDVAVGAQQAYAGEAEAAGAVYVIFGSRDEKPVDLSSLDDRGFRIEGPGPFWRVGWAVAAAGDFDGDKVDDIVAGDAYNRMLAPGYAAIVMGRRSAPAHIDATKAGTRVVPLRVDDGRQIGTAVAGIGDQNEDGFDEVAVLSRDLETEARVHVVFGGRRLGSVDLERLGRRGAELELGEAPADPEGDISGAGWSLRGLAAAGDVDGDGRQDLLVAAPPTLRSPTFRVGGGARIVSGQLIRAGRRVETTRDRSGIVRIDTFGVRVVSSQYGLSETSAALAGVGDLDGDGLDDVALSAPTEAVGPDSPLGYQGAVYVAFRRPSPGRGPLEGLLSHNGMGQVMVGLPVARAESLLNTTATIQNGTCGHLFVDDARIEVMVSEGSIARVGVTGPGLPTEAGIEVGDPVEAVEAAYDGKLERGPAEYYPEGSTLTARFDDGRKLVYTTDGTRVVFIAGGREPEVDYVEGCA
jgi:hypothetical protein